MDIIIGILVVGFFLIISLLRRYKKQPSKKNLCILLYYAFNTNTYKNADEVFASIESEGINPNFLGNNSKDNTGDKDETSCS